MARRTNGEGSIYQLKDGRWKAVITVGLRPDGRPIRKSRTCRKKADASAALQELRNLKANGVLDAQPENLSVRDFLTRWLDNRVTHDCEPTTLENYRNTVENHLVPRVGHLKTSKLNPMHVESLIAEMRKDGKGDRTIQAAYTVLQTALEYAVSPLGLMVANPCRSVTKPKYSREEIKPFTVEDIRRFLDYTKDRRLYPLYLLAFATGLRQAELFGLEWPSVDFAALTIKVERQAVEIGGKITVKKPKTAAGVRVISVPVNVMDAINEYRKSLLAAGKLKKHVFPGRDGAYLRKGGFGKYHWRNLLDTLEIEKRGFHCVRHTYATMQLSAGVPVHTVSKILGHSRPSTTLNLYSHWIPGDQDQATSKVSGWLG